MLALINKLTFSICWEYWNAYLQWPRNGRIMRKMTLVPDSLFSWSIWNNVTEMKHLEISFSPVNCTFVFWYIRCWVWRDSGYCVRWCAWISFSLTQIEEPIRPLDQMVRSVIGGLPCYWIYEVFSSRILDTFIESLTRRN